MTDYSRYETLLIEKKGGIATITLNRPDLLNAIAETGEGVSHREVEDIWVDLADDEEVNVIVITGAGRAFSAGGDIKGMLARTGTDLGWKQAIKTTRVVKRMLGNMLDVPQPIIAAVNGHAMGLGSTIAVMSDISVISETARIGDTHVRVGLVAGDGGTVAYPLLLGLPRAKDYLMRGLVIDGKEAERIGLINYSVPAEQVTAKAIEIADDINSLPPLAVRWTKSAINQAVKSHFAMIADSSVAYESLSMLSKDHAEATRAFAEKRSPKPYTGE